MTYIHKHINAQTGEEIQVPYTKAELDELKVNEKIDLAKAAERKAKDAQKAALLEKLGITETEAKLLLS
jgi:hypothetical protein